MGSCVLSTVSFSPLLLCSAVTHCCTTQATRRLYGRGTCGSDSSGAVANGAEPRPRPWAPGSTGESGAMASGQPPTVGKQLALAGCAPWLRSVAAVAGAEGGGCPGSERGGHGDEAGSPARVASVLEAATSSHRGSCLTSDPRWSWPTRVVTVRPHPAPLTDAAGDAAGHGSRAISRVMARVSKSPGWWTA